MIAIVLDRRDLDIVAVLQKDARATYAEVGKRVGLSPSSVHQRVRKLEEQGVISGYRARVNLGGTLWFRDPRAAVCN